jgi:hypothetical protein
METATIESGDRHDPKVSGRRRRRGLLGAALVAVLAAAFIVGRAFISAPLAEPLVPGDGFRWVGDGPTPYESLDSHVRVNEDFEKIWEIQNSGSVVWSGRYLRRERTPEDSGSCSSLPRVPIPQTKPGETIQIGVSFRAPSVPGQCYTEWRMVDDSGKDLFPNLKALPMTVRVGPV